MQTFQNHIIFRSFSDLYCEEKRQEERQERLSNSSSNSSSSSSRASSFSFNSSVAPSVAYTGCKLSRTSTQSSSDSNSSNSESQYYPAALYNSRMTQKMAQRELDTVTLNDEESSQDLSLRRF